MTTPDWHERIKAAAEKVNLGFHTTEPTLREVQIARDCFIGGANFERAEMSKEHPHADETYEFECEELGRMCETLGLDCSCCYDKEDLIRLITSHNENLNEKLQALQTQADALADALYKLSSHEPMHFEECTIDSYDDEECNCPIGKEVETAKSALASYKAFKERGE